MGVGGLNERNILTLFPRRRQQSQYFEESKNKLAEIEQRALSGIVSNTFVALVELRCVIVCVCVHAPTGGNTETAETD